MREAVVALIRLPRHREHAVACDSLLQLLLQALRFLRQTDPTQLTNAPHELDGRLLVLLRLGALRSDSR
jgi:hypothetical protein